MFVRSRWRALRVYSLRNPVICTQKKQWNICVKCTEFCVLVIWPNNMLCNSYLFDAKVCFILVFVHCARIIYWAFFSLSAYWQSITFTFSFKTCPQVFILPHSKLASAHGCVYLVCNISLSEWLNRTALSPLCPHLPWWSHFLVGGVSCQHSGI